MEIIKILTSAFKEDTARRVWFGVSAALCVALCTSIFAVIPAVSAWLAYRGMGKGVEVEE